MEQKEKSKSNEQQAAYAKEYAVKLEAEFQKVCDGILTMMDENLIPSASTGELQDHAAKTQDKLVDAEENAEVAEINRAVFRVLTRSRAATNREFEMIAGLETQAIDAYNDAHQYRGEDPLAHDPEIPQVQCTDETIDVPVVTQGQVLSSQTVGNVTGSIPWSNGWRPCRDTETGAAGDHRSFQDRVSRQDPAANR